MSYVEVTDFALTVVPGNEHDTVAKVEVADFTLTVTPAEITDVA